MRKITEDAINALYSQKPFKRDNTAVEVFPNGTFLKLCGNTIACLYNDPNNTLSITTAGWNTVTTKERLNGLDAVHVYTRKGQLYLNGEPWDGSFIDIEEGN